MTGKIEWLRSEEECRYSVSYLRRKATADEWELLHPGNGHRGVKMNARTRAETWIHVLRGAGHKEIIRSLQNNLRQRRIQKRTCQWPLILTHFWPIKLTHLGTANRQFSASADSSHLPA